MEYLNNMQEQTRYPKLEVKYLLDLNDKLCKVDIVLDSHWGLCAEVEPMENQDIGNGSGKKRVLIEWYDLEANFKPLIIADWNNLK